MGQLQYFLCGLWSNLEEKMVKWFGWCSAAEYKVETLCLCIGVKNQVRELDNFPAPPGIDLHTLGTLICVRVLEFPGHSTYPISYLNFKFFQSKLWVLGGFCYLGVCNSD